MAFQERNSVTIPSLYNTKFGFQIWTYERRRCWWSISSEEKRCLTRPTCFYQPCTVSMNIPSRSSHDLLAFKWRMFRSPPAFCCLLINSWTAQSLKIVIRNIQVMLVVIKSREESVGPADRHVTASTKMSKILLFHFVNVLKWSPLILRDRGFSHPRTSISSHLPQPDVPVVYPADGLGHLRSGWAAHLGQHLDTNMSSRNVLLGFHTHGKRWHQVPFL